MLALNPHCMLTVDGAAEALLRHQAYLPASVPVVFPTQSPHLVAFLSSSGAEPNTVLTLSGVCNPCPLQAWCSCFWTQLRVVVLCLHCFFAWDLASVPWPLPSQGQVSCGSKSFQQDGPCQPLLLLQCQHFSSWTSFGQGFDILPRLFSCKTNTRRRLYQGGWLLKSMREKWTVFFMTPRGAEKEGANSFLWNLPHAWKRMRRWPLLTRG